MPNRIPKLSTFLPYQLAITSNMVSGRIADEYRVKYGLRIPEWRVMAVLGDTGPATQRDLVKATLMDKVAVNRACKVLGERGLIARTPNSRDGRSHHLELTAEGKALHGECMPMTQDMFLQIFTDISESERAGLQALLSRIRDGVLKTGEPSKS